MPDENSKVEKPRYTVVTSLGELEEGEGFFRDNQAAERLIFRGIEFQAQTFSNVLFKNCRFERCTLVDCFFDRVDFQRVELDGCEIENCVLARGLRILSSTFTGSRLVGVDFSGALIQNVEFSKCSFDSVEFRDIKGKSVSFRDSTFSRTAFDRAHIVRGDFRGVAHLQRALFYTAKLEECAFDWSEAFIVMKFGHAPTDNLYDYAIVPLLKEFGYEPIRVDRYEFSGRIVDETLQNILTCQIVVAECSTPSPNVFFEVGYALGNKRDVVLLVDEVEKIPFDLKDFKFIIHHNSIDGLKEQLRPRLEFLATERGHAKPGQTGGRSSGAEPGRPDAAP